MLALTDAQLTTVMALARPLSPDQRSRFLELLAARLDGRREVGDGMLYQLCRDLQRQHFDPPITTGDASRSRRGRPRLDDDDDVDDRPRERLFGGQKQKMW